MQNEERFGEAKTADGVYATNALPSHHFLDTHGAIFATISRFNHACGAHACFKWNSKLGQMTVHATRLISLDEEITVNYGFPNGCVLREQRRKRLRDVFGFDCACRKCELSGVALQRSEELSAEIGDASTLLNELCVWGSLATLVCVDASQVLSRLEDRHQLYQVDGTAGHCSGVDAFLKSIVEFCEAAASRLFDIVHAAPRDVDALIMLEVCE